MLAGRLRRQLHICCNVWFVLPGCTHLIPVFSVFRVSYLPMLPCCCHPSILTSSCLAILQFLSLSLVWLVLGAPSLPLAHYPLLFLSWSSSFDLMIYYYCTLGECGEVAHSLVAKGQDMASRLLPPDHSPPAFCFSTFFLYLLLSSLLSCPFLPSSPLPCLGEVRPAAEAAASTADAVVPLA